MSNELAQANYSIAAVSKLTGVSCHALRVWERRYGFPSPVRSPSGHRRYPALQVAMLREIARSVQSGRSISEVIAEHRTNMPEDADSIEIELKVDENCLESPTDELLDRLFVGDFLTAESIFQRLADRMTPIELIGEVIRPSLVDSGERWFRKECEAFQERCASGFLLRKLSGLVEQIQKANPQADRTVLVGAVQGDRHEGGILCLCAALEWAGWKAISLGADLPVREYQRAIDHWKPDALALSFTLSRNIKKRFAELASLRGAPIIVGGRSILNYQGLARRHGLIVLTGPALAIVNQLEDQSKEWKSSQASRANGHA